MFIMKKQPFTTEEIDRILEMPGGPYAFDTSAQFESRKSYQPI